MNAKIVIHNSEFVIPGFLAQTEMKSPDWKETNFPCSKRATNGSSF
nr:hypothetical protein [uncultured Flavobacterium sp.]